MGFAQSITLTEIKQAQSALSGFIKATPLVQSAAFAPEIGQPLWFKTENLQLTGSFKVRGAFYHMAALSPAERAKGVIAASAGNHAQGVALAARQWGIPATVVMPLGAPITKVQSTQQFGAKVILNGLTYDDAQAHAEELQRSTGATLVPGFNDRRIIAGQGTIGLEIIEDLPNVATVLVPIGGGGLISGIALAVKTLRPEVRVIGVQAAGAPAVFRSKQLGEYTATASVRTMADGIAVKQPGRLNWEVIRRLVDDVVVVDEEEIGYAILMLLERVKLLTEGAGAVGLAALLAGKVSPAQGPAAVVLSGGNIDVNVLSRIIERGLVRAGRYIRLSTYVPDRPGGLQSLLAIIAGAGANIVYVHHERWLDKVTVGEVEIDLALETRNFEHVQMLLAVLRQKGYEARLVPAVRPQSDS